MSGERAIQQKDRLSRLHNERIEAPQEYIDYEGQVIVRTRYSTSQRWKTSDWDPGRKGEAPYILGAHYCKDPVEEQEPMNPELALNEIQVYYVDDSEKVHYKVASR